MKEELLTKDVQTGQILVEAILALGITMFIITGIVIALVSSLNNSIFTKNQNLASNFAQEGIDIARNQKESDYEAFSALGSPPTTYCLDGGQTTIVASKTSCPTPNIGSIFIRKIRIRPDSTCGPNAISVASIVSWNDSKCSGGSLCHKVELDSCFSNLNAIN